MSRLNSGFRSHLKELLDTLMPEALNHTIERIASLYGVSIEIGMKAFNRVKVSSLVEGSISLMVRGRLIGKTTG